MSTLDHGYGWPPFMLTRTACEYTGRDRSTLSRAAKKGLLPVAGRNGRSLVFEKSALDAFLLGERAPCAAPRNTNAPTRRAGNSAALERLAALRKGARQ